MQGQVENSSRRAQALSPRRDLESFHAPLSGQGSVQYPAIGGPKPHLKSPIQQETRPHSSEPYSSSYGSHLPSSSFPELILSIDPSACVTSTVATHGSGEKSQRLFEETSVTKGPGLSRYERPSRFQERGEASSAPNLRIQDREGYELLLDRKLQVQIRKIGVQIIDTRRQISECGPQDEERAMELQRKEDQLRGEERRLNVIQAERQVEREARTKFGVELPDF